VVSLLEESDLQIEGCRIQVVAAEGDFHCSIGKDWIVEGDFHSEQDLAAAGEGDSHRFLEKGQIAGGDGFHCYLGMGLLVVELV
jgi:hypothetical protein